MNSNQIFDKVKFQIDLQGQLLINYEHDQSYLFMQKKNLDRSIIRNLLPSYILVRLTETQNYQKKDKIKLRNYLSMKINQLYRNYPFQYKKHLQAKLMNQEKRQANIINKLSQKPLKIKISSLRMTYYLQQKYPNEVLRKGIRQASAIYPCYRPILGDGNCLHRSFVFQLLKYSNLTSYQTLFGTYKKSEWILKKVPFENFILQIGFQNILKIIWKQYLCQLPTQLQLKQQKIVQLFNKSQLFDVCMICFSRLSCISEIQNNMEKYSQFLQSEFISRIQQYGYESQFLQLQTLTSYFKMEAVLVIFYQNGRDITYKQEKIGSIQNNWRIFIMNRPGHYQIFYIKNQIDQKNIQIITKYTNKLLQMPYRIDDNIAKNLKKDKKKEKNNKKRKNQ